MLKELIKTLFIQKFSVFSRKFLSSAGYRLETWPSNKTEIKFNRSWSSKMIGRQHEAWRNLLKNANHNNRKDINALIKILKKINLSSGIVIEIGCGTAYNKHLLLKVDKTLKYIGLDSSLSALQYARKLDIDNRLIQGTSASIPLKNNSVDLVLDGAALIHILDWRASVKDYARVSKKFIILHSITLTNEKTTLFSKYAYGARVYEIAFNREELTSTFFNQKFRLTYVEPGEHYNLHSYIGVKTNSETWLLERTN